MLRRLSVLGDGSVVVLSDDGGDKVGEGERKDLGRDDPERRSRGVILPRSGGDED